VNEDVAARLERFQSEFARRLTAAMVGRSMRSVAMEAGLTHPTLRRILHEHGLPDVETIVRLEIALDVRLWPELEE